MDKGIWDLSVLDLEWKVGVDTFFEVNSVSGSRRESSLGLSDGVSNDLSEEHYWNMYEGLGRISESMSLGCVWALVGVYGRLFYGFSDSIKIFGNSIDRT